MRRRDTDMVSYLLGELDGPAAAAFEDAMAADAMLRDRVRRMRPVVEGLEGLPAEGWDPPAPPPLAHLPEPERRPRRLVLRPAAAVACAAVLLLGGVGLGVLLGDGEDAGPSAPRVERLELAPVAGAGATGRVEVAAGNRSATLRVSGLEPVAGFYELWLLGRDGELVSLGSFRAGGDGTATLAVPLPVDPAEFEFFDVSAEPADGDPGHSGESVLRGPASS